MAVHSKLQAELPGAAPPRRRRARWHFVAAAAAVTALLHFALKSSAGPRLDLATDSPGMSPDVCPQASALIPEQHGALWDELTALHATPAFFERAVAQLSAAVRIPTETFDEMGPVGEDARWITRAPFVEHLASAFPLLHAALPLQRVNTYGLIYTWQGTDDSLKPLLLMGHYDVVPVAPLSADQWTHPAYSGHFDGENIWGRGSSDDKSGVIGIMTTVEVLLEKGFTPARTVVLSFGFDEEAGGYHGAGHLGPALLERFGEDSFAMIVDEGSGYSDIFGAIFAAPGVAEKGHVNINVEVQTPGGHSSVPPAHTSIGILAALIVALEDSPPTPKLELDTPAFAMARCFAAHGPDMPGKLRRAIMTADADKDKDSKKKRPHSCKKSKSEKALKEAEKMLFEDKMFRALVGTTQAVDIILGGVKSNALPEQAMALVNHRIATQSSVNATLTRNAELLAPLAERFNLSLTAFGEKKSADNTAQAAAYLGTLELSAPQSLEPAPIAPADAPPFRLLAGTIRAAFRTARQGKVQGEGEVKEQDIFVTPGMMTGNTDTRFNWALSDHIFRYGHGNMIGGGLGGIHTVDEHIRADAFVEMITFFTGLILNADEAEL